MTDVIRVLVADDQALVLGGLVAMFNLETDLRVVAEVASGEEVLPAATGTQADIALLDVQMPGKDGLTPHVVMGNAVQALLDASAGPSCWWSATEGTADSSARCWSRSASTASSTPPAPSSWSAVPSTRVHRESTG